MQATFTLDGGEFFLWLAREEGGYRLHVDGMPAGPLASVRPLLGAPGRYTLSLDGEAIPVAVARAGDDLFIHLDGRTHMIRFLDPISLHAGGAVVSEEDDIRAPMPGIVLSVAVEPGQAVTAGETLVVIESMKMETRCPATRSGTVQAVLVTPGQSFERDQVLVTLAAVA